MHFCTHSRSLYITCAVEDSYDSILVQTSKTLFSNWIQDEQNIKNKSTHQQNVHDL